MRRILEAFTATSIPTGTFLMLLGMGSLGATPGLDSVQAEEPKELWATLQLPPPIELEMDLDSPDSPAVEATSPTPSEPSTPAPSETQSTAAPQQAAPESAPEATPTPRAKPMARKPFSARSSGSAPAKVARTPAPKRHAEGVTHTQPKKKGGTCMEHTDAIVKVSANKWTVERSFLEALANDRQAASRLAVLTWNNTTNGKVDGFKVRRVRCGSPLHQAGFRNGDVIHGVNGHKVTSLGEAIWTYGQVRKDSQLKVNLTRKDGSSAKLRYTVK